MNTTVNSTARSTGKKKADAPGALTLKPVHMRKLAAIIDVKGRALFSKNFIIMPVFSLGFTFLMQVLYERASGGLEAMNAYALAMGMLMNVSIMGFYCTAASLAEEKEKNTLRTLMTSSVNGLEFFLGSLIPIVLMTEARQCTLCLYRAYNHEPDAVGSLPRSHHYCFRHRICRRDAPRNLCKESGIGKYPHYTCGARVHDDSHVYRIQRDAPEDQYVLLYRDRIRCHCKYLKRTSRSGCERYRRTRGRVYPVRDTFPRPVPQERIREVSLWKLF